MKMVLGLWALVFERNFSRVASWSGNYCERPKTQDQRPKTKHVNLEEPDGNVI